MSKIFALANSFRQEEDGVALIEYTVLLGIITIAVIGSIVFVGGWVGTQWTDLEAELGSI